MASVQILMAVYNGEEYLSAQIESILAQSYEDWELLISDDCSSDSSLEVVKKYCKVDSRIRLVLDGAHFGSAKAHFMALIREASAPYVMTCDQDDVWDSNKIELTLNEMRRHEDGEKPLLVCTDLRVVDQDLNQISPSFLAYSGMDASKLDFGYFLASCLVTGCTMMMNPPPTPSYAKARQRGPNHHARLVGLFAGCGNGRGYSHGLRDHLLSTARGQFCWGREIYYWPRPFCPRRKTRDGARLDCSSR